MIVQLNHPLSQVNPPLHALEAPEIFLQAFPKPRCLNYEKKQHNASWQYVGIARICSLDKSNSKKKAGCYICRAERTFRKVYFE
jgi:hypothetical protein